MMVTNRVTRQWIATITCCLSTTMVASCFEWTVPLLTVDGNTHQHIKSSLIWVSYGLPLGAAFFSFFAGLLSDRFGRKAVLLQACPLVLVGWVVILTTSDPIALVIANFIHGFATAIVYVVAPTYLAEISETHKRGLLSGQFQVMYLVGVVYTRTMGSLLCPMLYIISLMVIPIITILAFYRMPESPYFLLMCQKKIEAIDALQWLRGSNDVQDEYSAMSESVEKEMATPRRCGDLVATISDKRSLSIVVLLSILRSLSGMKPLTIFLILQEGSSRIFASLPMAIYLMLVTLASTYATTFFTDSIGRKPILIAATIGTTSFCSIITICYALETTENNHGWLLYVAIIGFSVSYNVGIGGLMQTIQGEYFPCKTRALGGSVSTFLYGIFTFLSLLSYVMFQSAEMKVTYYILHTFVSLIGVIVIPVAYHESAGRTLTQIQEVGICRKKSTNNFVTTDRF